MSVLARIGRRKYVTQAALSEVLTEVKNAGMPEGTSRSSVKRARDNELASWANSIGEAITYLQFDSVGSGGKKPGTVRLPFVHPFWFLQVCLDKRPAFARYFQQHLAELGNDVNNAFEQPGSASQCKCYLSVAQIV